MYDVEKNEGPLNILISLFDQLAKHKTRKTITTDTSLIDPSILSIILKEKIRKRIHLVTEEEVSRVVGGGKGVIVRKIPALVLTDNDNIIAVYYMEDIFFDELDVAIDSF